MFCYRLKSIFICMITFYYTQDFCQRVCRNFINLVFPWVHAWVYPFQHLSHLRKNNLVTDKHGGQPAGNHLGRERPGAPIRFQTSINNQCMLVAKKTISIPVCTGRSVDSRPRDVLLPLCSSLVIHIWNTGPGLPSTRRYELTGDSLTFSWAVDRQVEFIRCLFFSKEGPYACTGGWCWFSIQVFRHYNRTAKILSKKVFYSTMFGSLLHMIDLSSFYFSYTCNFISRALTSHAYQMPVGIFMCSGYSWGGINL